MCSTCARPRAVAFQATLQFLQHSINKMWPACARPRAVALKVMLQTLQCFVNKMWPACARASAVATNTSVEIGSPEKEDATTPKTPSWSGVDRPDGKCRHPFLGGPKGPEGKCHHIGFLFLCSRRYISVGALDNRPTSVKCWTPGVRFLGGGVEGGQIVAGFMILLSATRGQA